MSDPKISRVNKKNLQLFLDTIERSDARKDIICSHIRYIFAEMPDVVGIMHDTEKVSKAMKKVRASTSISNFETIKSVGKSFVRFHNDDNTPRGWRYYKSNHKNQRRDLKVEDMISWQEIKMLSDATVSVQFKAIIQLQGEAGFRPSELIDLDFEDCRIKEGFAIVHVKQGKTGARDVICYKSAPALQAWLRQHPVKEGALWIKENQIGKNPPRYSYYAMVKRLRELGKRLGFKFQADHDEEDKQETSKL